MKCTLVYGLGRNMKHTENDLTVEQAFSKIQHLKKNGWVFIDIYADEKLVYTTQGGMTICVDCPYY